MEFDAGPFTVLFGKNNSGKTNILEALYDTINGTGFKPDRPMPQVTRSASSEGEISAFGALFIELDARIEFDAAVLSALAGSDFPSSRRVAFADGAWFDTDPHDSYLKLKHALQAEEDLGTLYAISAIEYFQGLDPTERPSTLRRHRPRRDHVDALLLDWKFNELSELVERAVPHLAGIFGDAWLEYVGQTDDAGMPLYRIQPKTLGALARFAALATELLPDFLTGQVFASVSPPTAWPYSGRVTLEYDDRPTGPGRDLPSDVHEGALRVESVGQGAARWVAAAAQIALHLLSNHKDLERMRDLGSRGAGTVLLLDEPEAHLHPSAVASVVRWCHRMVAHGFTVIVASHHEEFLRASGDAVTLVHVKRDAAQVHSQARTLPTATLFRLQELADDIGMHPASVLSLHKAILFVEGPLDEAVLEEYAGLELDAAGIKIIPIHGTKNHEGIVSAELITGLGIKIGVLFDNAITETMSERSNNRRSSEEKKLLKLIDLFDQRGLPAPEVFGVPEDDLLWALPAEGIREHLSPTFPGWRELREEARRALGAGPSDSFDWKSYALEHYGLEINSSDGVRRIVRQLDLSNVQLPSLRSAVDAIVRWAISP